MQMAGVQMDARSYAVTLSALLKARAEPEALRMTRAILDRLEEEEQAQLDRREEQEQEQEQQQQEQPEQEQAWVPWSRREAEGADEEGGGGAGEGAGGRRRPALQARLRVDAALCNVMLQVVMQAGEEGEPRRVLSRLRAAGLKPSVRAPSTQPSTAHLSPPPSPAPLNLHPHPHHSTLTLTLTPHQERTLSLMLSSLVKQGKVPAAVEVFNAHCAAGGTTGAVPFNILMSGFARQGELTRGERLRGLSLSLRLSLDPNPDH